MTIMRIASTESVGLGQRVAIVSTGVQCSVIPQATIGKRIHLVSGSVVAQSSTQDSMGRGTELALCFVEQAPRVEMIGFDVFNGQAKTNSTVLLAAMEEAISMDVDVLAVCIQSYNQDRQPLFQRVCQQAFEKNISIVACDAVDKISYPAHIDGCVGVYSNPDCREHNYYYDPEFFGTDDTRRRVLVSNGWWKGRFWGAEIATIRIAAQIACLRSSGVEYPQIHSHLAQRAYLPFDTVGFC